ncbi:MAG: hypothetical protein K0Q79_2422 [Flavipsychrobacter sp.]|jgi:hypothetical protein|nr:hypothetical protein [Flavipsychrobacter sp.]
MKAQHYIATITACFSLFFASCGSNTTENTNTSTKDTVATSVPLAAVTLGSVSPSPDFPGAALAMGAVKTEKVGTDSVKITFNFDVKNYELKLQTSDNGSKMCNNSAQGQHIHFIMDNTPYKALYEPTNAITLANNTEHYLFAFLSRSYHESIKSKGAALMYHFKIDEKGNLKKLEDPKTPMLIYSRPKGDYIGPDTTNILLDFYAWNCDISPEGYKVKADIANEDRNTQVLGTTLVKWEPYFIQNLGTGKCKVMLTLLDKDSKPVEGLQTSITREFNLKAQ